MNKIAINGFYGKMGQAIYSQSIKIPSLVVTVGCDVASKINAKETSDIKLTDKLSAVENLFDVVIDFTLPTPSLSTLNQCHEMRKPAVVGTTGFTKEQLEEIKQLSKDIPILLAPNMSMGVNVSIESLSYIAGMLKDYEITIEETHHINKVDSPSGTALKMANVIADAANLTLGDIESKDCPIKFISNRENTAIGTHTITFSSEQDEIVLTHNANTREIFAIGALRTANWIKTQDVGFYNYKDFMDSI